MVSYHKFGLVERPWSTERRGDSPPFFYPDLRFQKEMSDMAEKILSVFIDESGDFGAFDPRAPYYLVAMVLHDQSIDISAEITAMENRMRNLGYEHHAIHTGPLIRRESIYQNDLVEDRKHLFYALYYFSRKLDLHYVCAKVRKNEHADVVELTAMVSKAIASAIREHEAFFHAYDHIMIYYDNGQVELTRILTAVFSTLYTNVTFRKVSPADYRLFQVGDLVCTMELLAEKAESNTFSRSESEFFGSPRTFRKDLLKGLRKKML